MKRIFEYIYYLILIIIGVSLYFNRPASLTSGELFYMFNAYLIFSFGIFGLMQKRKMTVIFGERHIQVKSKGKVIEEYCLSNVLKVSNQHNRLTIYFKDFTKHFIYNDYTRSSQRILRSYLK